MIVQMVSPDERELNVQLIKLYEEIMWLAKRPNITPSEARAWFTHVRATKLRLKIRRFSGKVSAEAAKGKEELRLEHFERIQTKLTDLVSDHVRRKFNKPEEFINSLLKWEQVHIVTRTENYAAMRHKGDYKAAGIKLISWNKLPSKKQEELWAKAIKGRVCNADKFKPKG